MGREQDVISRRKLPRGGLSFNEKSCSAFQKHHPFVPTLIIPLPGWRPVTPGNDPLQPPVPIRKRVSNSSSFNANGTSANRLPAFTVPPLFYTFFEFIGWGSRCLTQIAAIT
jgi:hypothetical protein